MSGRFDPKQKGVDYRPEKLSSDIQGRSVFVYRKQTTHCHDILRVVHVWKEFARHHPEHSESLVVL